MFIQALFINSRWRGIIFADDVVYFDDDCYAVVTGIAS